MTDIYLCLLAQGKLIFSLYYSKTSTGLRAYACVVTERPVKYSISSLIAFVNV